MCGIAGIINTNPDQCVQPLLDHMLSTLQSRGPDDHNTQQTNHCSLVHTRLAVIDPDHARQPMSLTRPDGSTLTIVFNGEIYNHRQLRQQLTAQGHTFTSDHADTEALLHAYLQWQHDCIDHLDGMYAFAIHDSATDELFLARDPIGKKPLYYTLNTDRNLFAFGSLPATLTPLTDHTIAKQYIPQYLSRGYTNTQTLNPDIQQLPPGGRITISSNLTLTTLPTRDVFQRVNASAQPTPKSTKELQTQFHDLLTSAVQKRLEADVPLGCFLSGGIDSSLIAALTQKHRTASTEPLQTFCAVMPDIDYDESHYARTVANHLKTKHHELVIESDFEKDLYDLITHIGQPFGDSSLLPTYWLARAMREHVTVALSGDGGDELFFGYDRYRALQLIRKHRWWVKHIPRSIFLSTNPKSTGERAKRFITASRENAPPDTWNYIVHLFTKNELKLLLPEHDITAELSPTHQEWEELQLNTHLHTDDNPITLARLHDIQHYLINDLLQKVDRASMKCALEVRSPFLDTNLLTQIIPLSYNTLCPTGQPKELLKQIAAPYLPQEIIKRKKMGFALPIGQWFKDKHLSTLNKWLLDDPTLTDLGFSRSRLEFIIEEHAINLRDHTQRLFCLLTLAMHSKANSNTA